MRVGECGGDVTSLLFFFLESGISSNSSSARSIQSNSKLGTSTSTTKSEVLFHSNSKEELQLTTISSSQLLIPASKLRHKFPKAKTFEDMDPKAMLVSYGQSAPELDLELQVENASKAPGMAQLRGKFLPFPSYPSFPNIPNTLSK